jgi:hypothetical protein
MLCARERVILGLIVQRHRWDILQGFQHRTDEREPATGDRASTPAIRAWWYRISPATMAG